MKKWIITLGSFLFLCAPILAQKGNTLPIVYDPVLIEQNGCYYIFCTGWGINVYSSSDRKHWVKQSPVFAAAPSWAVSTISGFKGHVWAPYISYHNGQYYLYYAVSAFGKNTSAIGVATNKTVDTTSKDFSWTDHGKVLQSVPGRDMWNAIDPNLVIDSENGAWLAFGSFWNGIKLVKMNADLLSIAQPEQWYTIASRKRVKTCRIHPPVMQRLKYLSSSNTRTTIISLCRLTIVAREKKHVQDDGRAK